MEKTITVLKLVALKTHGQQCEQVASKHFVENADVDYNVNHIINKHLYCQ